MPTNNTLRLLDGGTQADGLGVLGAAPKPLPQLTRRPGDHLELHSFESGEKLAPIRLAARKRGLDSETALALVVERDLAVTEIEERAGRAMVVALDHQSAEAEARVALWSANGSYLQHLLGLRPAAASGRPLNAPRVALPVRLLDRLDGKFFGQDDPDREIAAAIRWEVAALVASRTISEWAYRAVALELLG
jgi:hypothetical protein